MGRLPNIPGRKNYDYKRVNDPWATLIAREDPPSWLSRSLISPPRRPPRPLRTPTVLHFQVEGFERVPRARLFQRCDGCL